jgi:hypothetical protein
MEVKRPKEWSTALGSDTKFWISLAVKEVPVQVKEVGESLTSCRRTGERGKK